MCYKTGKYNSVTVYVDSDKKRGIQVGRAIASTFLGSPPSIAHTADHKNRNPTDDTLSNIRWLCKSGQRYNQERSETLKSALIVVKNNIEKTSKEWVEYLKDQKNHMGREYNTDMIKHYAQKKQHGFSYKEYPHLEGEMWKEIEETKTDKGRWEISDMNRVKYITKHAENVLYGERLRLVKGYPTVHINGKNWACHIISFMTFFPEEYAAKKPEEFVLHDDDDKLDFRPHKLRLGNRSQNAKDAHENGRHDGTKTMRMKCESYINGIFEKEHESQRDAARYLKTFGYAKAAFKNIGKALSGERKTAYDRTWKLV